MRRTCPSQCEAAKQRPLERNEISELSSDTRASLVLLRKQALVCATCGAVYVRSPAGMIHLENLATVGQPVMPFDPGPSTTPVTRPLR
jgi:hypothetical protein